MNLKKKRKKHPIRNLFIASGCSAIVAYIGTQLNEASKRYELKKLSYDSDLYRLDKIEQEQPLDQPTQLYHEFRITEKATNEFLGTCKVYMGQEQTSYYENPAKEMPILGPQMTVNSYFYNLQQIHQNDILLSFLHLITYLI